MNMTKQCFCALIFGAFLTMASAAELVKDGKTDYVVVTGTNGYYDTFAVNEFTEIMKKSTGADFPVVKSGTAEAAKGKRVFIGDSPEMRHIFGEQKLESMEQLVREKDGSLMICGGGNNGTPYSVFLFLENEIGYRCFTPFAGGEKIPNYKNLTTSGKDMHRKIAFYLFRNAIMAFLHGEEGILFVYRNCGNATPKVTKRSKKLKGEIQDDCSDMDGGHGFFLYITTKERIKYDPWDEPQDYFATHPEYFSMDKAGERTTHMQLCFSNPDLRKEFTKRVIERGKRVGGKGFLTIGANDVPGSFCFCEKCMDLEKKYQTPAGAFFDYIPELCAAVAQELPDLRLSTLAYRKKQTEIPPAGVTRMPENWICDFAPVDDDQGQCLDDTNNQETLKNLKKWHSITNNITYWFYSCISNAPFGIVERVARDMKIMYENGVRGIGICGWGTPGMFPLQEYLTLRLAIDPSQDPWRLVQEYAQHMYGAAAQDMISYIKELEEVWKEPKQQIGLYGPGTSIKNFTPERLMRWQKMFDIMEQKVPQDSFEYKNLALARWDIDILTLDNWGKVSKAFPDTKYTPERIIERMRKVELPRCLDKGRKQQAEASYLVSKALAKTIPEPLNNLPYEKITQIPLMGGQYGMPDSDAACGAARTQPFEKDQMTKSGKKIGFNFYDQILKKAHKNGQVDVSKCTPGKYELYHVTTTSIPRDGIFAFDVWWGVNVPMAMYYPEGDEFKEFEIWASLKFVGPSFGIPAEDGKDRMFCDRLFLVDRSK